MKSVLVTGASGFIGSFMVEQALQSGYTAWAGLRASSSRRYLKDERIRFLVLDMGNPDTLRVQLADHKVKFGKIDYIIHCAGVTKCLDKREFDRVNYQQTVNFVEALRELDMIPELFVYLSSLSVFGPVHETDYKEILETDPIRPNTAYGISKRKAELYLAKQTDFPYVIFRPTGVYGPRETDYYLMAKTIRNRVDFSVGYKRQDITFVYVKDVVQGVFKALEKGKAVVGRTYFLSDGKVYQSSTFSNLLAGEMGIRHVLRIRVPLWFLWIVSEISEHVSGWMSKTSTLNSDKYQIMKQRNWRCSIREARTELGYEPEYDLRQGVKETMAWYKKEKWI